MNLLLLFFFFLALLLVAILGLVTWRKLQPRAVKGLVLLILTIAFSIYILALTPRLGTIGDNAHYIILTKSLLQGHFSSLNLPDNPPETVYGFGLPLLLIPPAYFFPDSYGMWKIVPLLFGLSSLLLIFLLFRNESGSRAGLVVMALAAVNPYLLIYSHLILTEVPYLFFSLLTILLVKKYALRSSWMNFSFLGAALALLMTYFTRTIGLSLFLAIVIFLCLGRQFKKAGAISLFFLFFGLLWAYRNYRLASPDSHNYLGQFLMRNPYAPQMGKANLNDVFFRVQSNIKFYWYLTGKMIGGIGLGRPLFWAISGLTLLGFLSRFRKKNNLIELYLVFYSAILLLWFWRGSRFLVVVVPFLLWYFLQGVDLIFRKIPDRRRLHYGAKSLQVIVLSLVLLVGVRGSYDIVKKRNAPYPPPWANYFAVAAWAKDNTPPDSLIMGRKSNLLYLFSGRKTVNYPFTTDSAKIMAFIEKKRVDYVLVDAFTWTPTTRLYLYPAVNKNWRKFALVVSTGEPKTYLLKVKRGPIPGKTPATKGDKP